MKRLFLSLVFLAATVAQAAETINVGVNGMVCSFCAQGLTKKFLEEPAVESVDVSLKKKNVRVTLKEGETLSDQTIKDVVGWAGYTVSKIERK